MAWTLIKAGGEAENFGMGHKEFMIDSVSDIDTEPTDQGVISPGSFAYTGGYDTIFQKDLSGHWIEVSNGDGPHTLAWGNITEKPVVFPPDAKNLQASGNVSIITGNNGEVPTFAVAQGGTTVTGACSVAFGSGATSTGAPSLAIGPGASATGNCSMALGPGNASGQYSLAIGGGAKASNSCSFSAGPNNVTGAYAASFGNGNTSQGNNSISEGSGTTAIGMGSHAEGGGTVAASQFQHVSGTANIVDDQNEYAVIVGNGTAQTPSNAYTLDWQGNAQFAGDVIVNAFGEDGTSMSLVGLIFNEIFGTGTPTEDGTYSLKCTVANGETTIDWVADS